MLGSNQRPLPCDVSCITSWLFAAVQNWPRNSDLFFLARHACSLLFAWVGVLTGASVPFSLYAKALLYPPATPADSKGRVLRVGGERLTERYRDATADTVLASRKGHNKL